MQRASGWQRGPSLYSLILRQTFPHQTATILLGLALPALAVYPLHLQQRMIDDAIPAGDIALLADLALLFGGAILLRSALKFAVVYIRGWISAIVARVLRTALVDAQRRRAPIDAAASIGPVTSVLTAEVQPLGDFSAEAISTPLIQGGTLLGVLGYMLATDWRLALIGIVALATEAVVTPILQIRINRLTEQRIAALRRGSGDMIEALEPTRHDRFLDALTEVRRTYLILLRMNALKAALKVARNLIDHAADLAVLTLGALLVIGGEIEVGVIVAFLSGLREIRWPWGEMVSFYRRLADAGVKYVLVKSAIVNHGARPGLPRPVVA